MMQRIIALLLLILLTPFELVLIFLALLFQGYPLFYNQKRVGLNREEFVIYKLRSMSEGDVTPFGRLLRKAGLDEFPQLINIVIGDMGFVGPRPLTQADIERLGWNSTEFDLRWSVLPGLTGPAQTSPVCSAANTWKLDAAYCSNKGFRQDLRVLFLTFTRVCLGKSEVR